MSIVENAWWSDALHVSFQSGDDSRLGVPSHEVQFPPRQSRPVVAARRSPLLAALVRRLPPLGVEVADVLDGDAGRLRRARHAELLVLLAARLVAHQQHQQRGRAPMDRSVRVSVPALRLFFVRHEMVTELQNLYIVVDVRGRFPRILQEGQRLGLAGALRPEEARSALELHLEPADGVARGTLLALQLV